MKTCVAFLILIAIVACQPAWAKPEKTSEPVDLLSLMPDNTLGMVVANDPAALLGKVIRIAKKLDAPMPKDPIAQLKKDFRPLKHVDLTRPAAAAIVQASGGPFPVGFIAMIPVKDYAAFVKAAVVKDIADKHSELGPGSIVAIKYEGYAILANPGGDNVLKTIGKNKGKVAAEFGPLKERMDAGDVSGGATRAGIEIFAGFAKMGIQAVQAQMENLPAEETGGMQPQQIGQILSIYTLMIDEMTRTVQTYGFSMRIEKGAIISDDIIRLKNKDLGEKLAQVPAYDISHFTNLPAGRPFIAFGGATPKSLMSGMLVFSKKAMLAMQDFYGMDEKEIDELLELYDPVMSKMKDMSLVMSVPRKGGSIYSGMGGYSKVEGGAGQYIEDNIALFKKLTEAMKGPKGKSMMTFSEPQPIEIDGKKGISISFKIKFEIAKKGSREQQEIDEMMSRLFGKRGSMTIFMVAVDKETVAYAYDSEDQMKQVIAAASGKADKTLGSIPAYEEALALLPKDAQWIGTFDIGGYMGLIKKMLGKGNFPPGLKIPASPAVMGITATKDEVQIRSAITIKTIRRIAEAFKRMEQAQRSQPLAVPSIEALPAPKDDSAAE